MLTEGLFGEDAAANPLCAADSDCPAGQVCLGGGCQAAPAPDGAAPPSGLADAVVKPSSVDFGSPLLHVETCRAVEVFNRGNATLEVTRITLEEDDETPEFVIRPEGDVRWFLDERPEVIEVCLVGVDDQEDHGRIVIFSNDPDQPELTVELTSELKGEPFPGWCGLGGDGDSVDDCPLRTSAGCTEESEIDFGSVDFGTTSVRELAVWNDGTENRPLRIDAIDVSNEISLGFLFAVDVFFRDAKGSEVVVALDGDVAPFLSVCDEASADVLYVRVTFAATTVGRVPGEVLRVHYLDEYGEARLTAIAFAGLVTCVPGTWDANGSASDGCEYACTPTGDERCDAVDNDCDGSTDEGFATGMACDGPDADVCVEGITLCTQDGLGTTCNDDTNSSAEVCDGEDNDCDLIVDEGCNDDGDDYCDSAMAVSGALAICPLGAGDCDDMEPRVFPGAVEQCDGRDNDCDADVDEGCDDDDDDFCDALRTTLGSLQVCPHGGGDCDDVDPTVGPGVSEICDGRDNDCDALIDEGCDDDDDGTCDAGMVQVESPSVCPGGGGDCNDTNAEIHVGAIESCDDVDNNCNGIVDEGCDDDDDNVCDAGFVIVGVPATCTAGGGDCNDAAASLNPGAVELCDDLDNDCDGLVDEGCDDDHDGYCDNRMVRVGSPAVCAMGGGDCDDGRSLVNPAAVELCDDLNNDCDSAGVDEGCDEDNDNACGAGMVVVGAPETCTAGGGDCNDANPSVNPAALELCDDQDNDCDGLLDEGCDDDNDNYCDSTMVVVGSPTTCTVGGADCNDVLDTVNPGAREVCDNLNNDCDTAGIDEGCDNDGDDYCDEAMEVVGSPTACPQGGGDCDDRDVTIHPGAMEACDDLDNDCDSDGADEDC